MDYRNADGSIVEMCGNGVRVVAKHVVDHGLVDARRRRHGRGRHPLGTKPVRIVARHDDGSVAEVEVDMGPPILAPRGALRGRTGRSTTTGSPTRSSVDGLVLDLAVVSMGNPHAILEVDDVASAPVTTLGPRVETHGSFPAKTNVEFVEVLAEDQVRLRVWERGVGETAACGTGACATVVALQRLGQVGEEVAVRLPGGTLMVRWRPGGSVFMTGPAVEVGHGTLDDAWLAAARRGEMEGARS
jgi:diaminopimelate epimerase